MAPWMHDGAPHVMIRPIGSAEAFPARHRIPIRFMPTKLSLRLARGWTLTAVLGLCTATPALASQLPRHLGDTGLYADRALTRLAAGLLDYTPQYPLWSDGATKRR